MLDSVRLSLLVASFLFAAGSISSAQPPFEGTLWLDPDIIKPSDPTTLESITAAGTGSRLMYDRRCSCWSVLNATLFDASFDDGLTTEVQLNPEFGKAAAARQAEKYARAVGQLPTALRTGVETLWIHRGDESFGGGNNSIDIYVGFGEFLDGLGVLEEALLHEGVHASLQAHGASAGWLSAQNADGGFISTYARDNPNREDVSESFPMYLALKYRAERISESLANTIAKTIPNRIAYFDNQFLDLYPIDTKNTLGPTGPCVRDSQTACLLGDRFDVTVTMWDFSNPPDGPGAPLPGMIQFYNGQSSETEQAVSFYTFQEGNVEVFIKMIDACSFSGSNAFWIFAAGATNAETVILIRDTWTRLMYRIDNARGGDFFIRPDTQAFRTCDASPPSL